MDGFIDLFLSDEQNIFLPIEEGSFPECGHSCTHEGNHDLAKLENCSEGHEVFLPQCHEHSESAHHCHDLPKNQHHYNPNDVYFAHNPMQYLDFAVKTTAEEDALNFESNISFPTLAPTDFLHFTPWIKEEPMKSEDQGKNIIDNYITPKALEKETKAKKIHKCTYCSKTFSSKSGLKSHMKIHTRVPNSYICKFDGCNKKYSTSEGLRLHIRNHHTFDKKFICPDSTCGKRFVRQSDLRLHFLRMHAKERPYPCTHQGCSKSFACKSELRRHMQSHLRKRKRKAGKERTLKHKKS